MSFLRIGVTCVVVNHEGHVLLSRRRDLRVWNIPAGRLDYGERLEDAAAREVEEETGVKVAVERLVSLNYITRWERLAAIFRAHPIGGTLVQKTDETLDNGYFAPDALPEPLMDMHRQRITDALTAVTPILRVYETPEADYRAMRWRFGVRWIENLLRGRPEPRWARFETWAAEGERRMCCDGRRAPWEALGHSGDTVRLSAMAQDVARGMITFTFSLKDLPSEG